MYPKQSGIWGRHSGIFRNGKLRGASWWLGVWVWTPAPSLTPTVTKVTWPLRALFLYITRMDDGSINTVGLLWGLKEILPHTWSAKKRPWHVDNPCQTWSSALVELCFPSLTQVINFSNIDHFRHIKCISTKLSWLERTHTQEWAGCWAGV